MLDEWLVVFGFKYPVAVSYGLGQTYLVNFRCPVAVSYGLGQTHLDFMRP
jgi:hypothetical protein